MRRGRYSGSGDGQVRENFINGGARSRITPRVDMIISLTNIMRFVSMFDRLCIL